MRTQFLKISRDFAAYGTFFINLLDQMASVHYTVMFVGELCKISRGLAAGDHFRTVKYPTVHETAFCGTRRKKNPRGFFARG